MKSVKDNAQASDDAFYLRRIEKMFDRITREISYHDEKWTEDILNKARKSFYMKTVTLDNLTQIAFKDNKDISKIISRRQVDWTRLESNVIEAFPSTIDDVILIIYFT